MTTPKIEAPAGAVFRAVSADEAIAFTGPRNFYDYRTFDIEKASADGLSVTYISAKALMEAPTGWHYHECGVQFVYVVSGWMDLVDDTETVHRMKAGDVFMMPGGYVHDELEFSADYSALQVVSPAGITTVPCERPHTAATS